MPQFQDVLSRADTSVLQELLGYQTVRLLQALSDGSLRPSMLKSLLLTQTSAQQLLENPKHREKIIDLLAPAEATALCEHLGVATGRDPFDTLQRTRIGIDSERLRSLLMYFGIVHSEKPEVEQKMEQDTASPAYGLFEHQRRALRELSRLLARPYQRRAVLHMPTGAGKTRTTMNFVAEHLRARESTLVFWFATTEELCAQAEEEFTLAWRHLGNREVTIHRVWGGRPFDLAAATDGIVIASLATVYRRTIDTGVWAASAGHKTTLIIMDEAHQAIAPTYRLVLDSFTARREDMILVGLTATPGRTWDNIAADEELADYFERQKVTLTVAGYPNPVEYLIAEGYLARPTFIKMQSKTRLTHEEQAKLAEDLDVPDSVLERLAGDQLRSVGIIREVKALARRHQRILVFATTAPHAELVASILASLGVAAQSITARSAARQRREAVYWYKADADEPRVLVNFGVLTTGFDAPRTSAALIARPTKSLVLFSQMVGRATRGPRAGGNPTAEIITVVDTSLEGFGDMSQAFNNWEDVW